MFDSLLAITIETESQAQLLDLGDATPVQMLQAQAATADVLTALGVPTDEEIDAQVQRRSAREAFTALAINPDDDAQKAALAQLKCPDAVQQTVSMLSAYDWEFVDQAKQMRGYAVAKILEETTHPDARIRLKALQMLGNVTEVKLFTERVEVRKVDATEAEIEAQLKERLAKFLKPTLVQEVAATVLAAPETPAADDIQAQIAAAQHATIATPHSART
jgi:hypothetical protein